MSVTRGEVFTPVRVAIVDSAGNVVQSASDTITLALAYNPGGATLSGTTTLIAQQGIAKFTDLRLDKTGQGYTLAARASHLSAATSLPFDVIPVPPQPSFLVQPAGGRLGAAMEPAIAVELLDENGNRVTAFKDSIILQVDTASGTSAIAGTLGAAVQNGVAVFKDVRGARIGSGFRLVAKSYTTGKTATSDPFAVTPLAPQPSPLAVSASASCAIDQGGAVHCWGEDRFGQLGRGRTLLATRPVAVANAPSLVTVTGGDGFACGLTQTGEAWCWGDNIRGALGDGTLLSRATPRPVQGGIHFASLSAGRYACGLTPEGTLYCWGDIIDNGDDGHSDPIATTPMRYDGFAFKSVSVGFTVSCAVDSAGAGWCWDPKNYNQRPTRIPGTQTFRTIDAGGLTYTCGLTTDGAAWCWKRGDPPQPVAGGMLFASIQRGDSLTCGLTQNGAAYCWTALEQPVAVAAGLRFRSLAMDRHVCGITTGGQAYCWGDNRRGQLGNASTITSVVPVPVAGSASFALIQPMGSSTCAITTAGETECWGDNQLGILGDGVDPRATTPQSVIGQGSYVTISVGGQHACALDQRGAAHCWGDAQSGKLGDGGDTTVNSSVPRAVAGGNVFVSISAGSTHTCALTGEGDAYCWGFNANGELGDGTTTSSVIPRRVVGGHRFVRISAGNLSWFGTANQWVYMPTCAVASDGVVWCWGPTSSANGSNTTPVAIPGNRTFVSVGVGNEGRACGLSTDGHAYCLALWSTYAPMLDAYWGPPFSAFSGLGYNWCSIDGVGQAWCWGPNDYGELGRGSTGYQATSGPVVGNHTFQFLAAGNHSCGGTTTGEIWCWGVGGAGQLGNGTTTNSSVPVPVQGVTLPH